MNPISLRVRHQEEDPCPPTEEIAGAGDRRVPVSSRIEALIEEYRYILSCGHKAPPTSASREAAGASILCRTCGGSRSVIENKAIRELVHRTLELAVEASEPNETRPLLFAGLVLTLYIMRYDNNQVNYCFRAPQGAAICDFTFKTTSDSLYVVTIFQRVEGKDYSSDFDKTLIKYGLKTFLWSKMVKIVDNASVQHFLDLLFENYRMEPLSECLAAKKAIERRLERLQHLPQL